ncbi:hypothetical protein chiPu_0020516 [Chiloscyllium punctatum]|uniref:Uncharacterized protein n=1 Tax=Chiloscyllium punctatum TaxID=137246 RepID=A0A401RGH7_CHIPU|nr:hypothetical protein [Chiloscyllium punctatum]
MVCGAGAVRFLCLALARRPEQAQYRPSIRSRRSADPLSGAGAVWAFCPAVNAGRVQAVQRLLRERTILKWKSQTEHQFTGN